MKFYKSKFFIISVIIAAVLVLIPALLSAFGYTGIVTSVLKTVAKPFEAIGNSASKAVSGFVSVFTEYDKLKEENAALKEELQSVEELEHENDVLTAENEWLKNYLKMKNDFPEFVLTDASIISRESGNYATVLTLDRGQLHGIKKNMPVVTADGVPMTVSAGTVYITCTDGEHIVTERLDLSPGRRAPMEAREYIRRRASTHALFMALRMAEKRTIASDAD